MNIDCVIQASNIGMSFGLFKALDSVSFNLCKGNVLALVGSNGAGKSTLLKILSGSLRQSHGEIRLNNQIFDVMNPGHRAMVGVVPQEYAFYPELTALENLRFFAKIYGPPSYAYQNRLMEILCALNFPVSQIHEKSKIYSGGNKRKLNLALGFVHNPSVLFLDEPTVGIDAQSKKDIYRFIKSITQNQKAVIIATHHMKEVEDIADEVGFMAHGKMVFMEKVSKLLNKQNFCLRISLEKSGVQPGGSVLQNYPRAKVIGRFLQIDCIDGSNNLAETLAFLASCGVDLDSVQILETGLEQIYLKNMGFEVED